MVLCLACKGYCIGDAAIGVAVIPHTYANTIIKSYTPSCGINVEVDMIAKYVEKLLSHG